MSTFSTHEIPDLSGTTAIVTGANSGIGRAAAAALAAHGARLILAVRNTDKGHEAAAEMTGDVEVRRLDLASLASIHEFADSWEGEVGLLINNGGVMIPPLSRTADGFELQFGTNHLGHFALSNRLLEHVTGRIVTVTSVLHRIGRIDFDDLNWERRRYRPWRAYGDSKLANLLFTAELQRRLTEAGSPVKATAAHPGLASTNVKSHSDRALYRVAGKVLDRLVSQDADGGALPTLYAALAEIPDNGLAGPAGLFEIRGGAKLVGRSGAAEDMNVAGRLWEVSEQLTGTRFPRTPRAADQMKASA